jgi:hypothetical protein
MVTANRLQTYLAVITNMAIDWRLTLPEFVDYVVDITYINTEINFIDMNL